MNMLELKGLRRAEQFVIEQKQAGADVRWDGWDIVFFRPAPDAYGKVQGVYNRKQGAWGYDNRSVVNSDGIWEVDFRNVRRRIPSSRH